MTKKRKRLRAVVGLSFADGTRVEAGKFIPESVEVPEWLIEQGKVSDG